MARHGNVMLFSLAFTLLVGALDVVLAGPPPDNPDPPDNHHDRDESSALGLHRPKHPKAKCEYVNHVHLVVSHVPAS
jgi:hypothetical protein